MDAIELLAIIKGGESSKVQFKERMPHQDSFAHELIAFSKNDEIARLLGSRNLLADETEIFDSSIKDIDVRLFSEYFKKEFGIGYEEKGLTLEEALVAKKVMRNNHLTLAGLLFFGNEPQSFRPAFTIKAVMFNGNDIGGNDYRSKPEERFVLNRGFRF